jgi:hypothetical protein
MCENISHDSQDRLGSVDLCGMLVDEFLQFVPDGASWRYLYETLSFHWEIFDGGAVLGHFDALGKIKVQQIVQQLYHCVHWFGFLQVAVGFNVIHDV